MSRQCLRHDLPPLAHRLAGFRGFGAGECRAERIADLLRPLARRFRTSRPRLFYPLREIASFFHVSIPTAADAYRRMEEAGLLTSRRGGMTLLPARASATCRAVRGVVGVPVWTPGFVGFRDWRIFVAGLDEAVRKHGFVADLIFYRQGEELEPAFTDRVLKHRPDVLVWFRPSDGDWATLQRIEDAGVRLVAVSAARAQAPARRYDLDRTAGLREGLREWRADGIKTVILPQLHAKTPETAGIIERMDGLRPAVRSFSPRQSVAEILAALEPTPGSAVFFDHDVLFSVLCQRAPGELARLFRRHRVAVTQMIDLGWEPLADARVDTLIPDLAGLAKRIADDIALERHRQAGTVTLATEWRSRVPAADLATHFGME